MGKFTTLFFILSLQLSLCWGTQIQIQQLVNNLIGGCAGGPCGNEDPAPDGRANDGCVGNHCNVTEECTCSNAFCNRGVCLCPDGFRESDDGACEVLERGVQKCTVDDDCFDEKKECYKSFCVCKVCYKFDLEENCIAVLGSGCRDDEECENGEHMICERDMCVCDVGYIEDPEDEAKCIRDESCTDVSCTLQKRDSICVDKACVCPPDMRDFAGVCADRNVPLDGDCEFTWQCSDTTENAVCRQDFTCGCKDGYLENGGACNHPSNCSLGDACVEDACCLTTTPDSFCDCTADPKVCACKPPSIQHDGVDPPVCIFAKVYDEPCSFDEECEMTDDKLQCDADDNKCDCIDGYTYNGFRCVIVGGKNLGDDCTLEDVCITPNSECIEHVCRCEEGFRPFQTEDGELQCVAMADPGEECMSSIECQLEDPLTRCEEDPADPPRRICVCSKTDSLAVYLSNGRCYKEEPVLGDACELDAKCQVKFPDSVCFEGFCHCNDQKVETTRCESSTLMDPPCDEDKFEKYLTSTTATIESRLYETAYPPNKVFCYSVVAPKNKILKVKIVKMVLAEGTTVKFYMEPRRMIAQLDGMTNNHYDDMVFYTYQNHFLVTLITGNVRAKGFKIEVEVVEPGHCPCYQEIALTADRTPLLSSGQSPFCHIRMTPPKRSDFIFATLDALTPLPTPPQPLNLWDSVSDLMSMGVLRTEPGPTEHKFIAYPDGGFTIIQHFFDSIDATPLNLDFVGEAWHQDYKDARDCGDNLEVGPSSALATEIVMAGNTKLCAWQLEPKDDGKHLELTVNRFLSGNHGGMYAVYCGDLSSDVLGVRLNQFDYDKNLEVFESSPELPGLYILMRASNAASNVEIDFEVRQVP